MSGKGWHILREPGALTLCRARPPRFDFAVEAATPLMGKTRLAHQVRQDLWRALRSVRGFSPVVRVEERGAEMLVRAGGRVDGAVPNNAAATAQAVLDDPANRRRWEAYAKPRARRRGAEPAEAPER